MWSPHCMTICLVLNGQSKVSNHGVDPFYTFSFFFAFSSSKNIRHRHTPPHHTVLSLLRSWTSFLFPQCSLSPVPCHCHLIFLSPVHHHHHHYHHFHYASLHLFSTPDSKLTFSINPFHHIFGRFSRIFMIIYGLNCSSVFFCFVLFIFFVWFVW